MIKRINCSAARYWYSLRRPSLYIFSLKKKITSHHKKSNHLSWNSFGRLKSAPANPLRSICGHRIGGTGTVASMAPSLPPRTAFIERNTNETKIQVSLSLDGGPLVLLPDSEHFPSSTTSNSSFYAAPMPEQTEETHASQDSPSQQIWVWTGIGFLDHLLHAIAKHSGWSLRLRSKGDLASKS